jgi:hypothetical protein
MFLILDLMAMMPAGFFQPANRIGSLFAKAQQITTQFVPKQDAFLLAKAIGKVQRQRTMAGAGDIFA